MWIYNWKRHACTYVFPNFNATDHKMVSKHLFIFRIHVRLRSVWKILYSVLPYDKINWKGQILIPTTVLLPTNGDLTTCTVPLVIEHSSATFWKERGRALVDLERRKGPPPPHPDKIASFREKLDQIVGWRPSSWELALPWEFLDPPLDFTVILLNPAES